MTRIAQILPLVFLALTAYSQQTLEEYRLQQQQIVRSQLMQQMDSGVYLMDAGEYELADKKFRIVLEKIQSVPSDLTFFFGKNSYHLGLYKQSIDWLNKYVQLKGTTGQFSKEASEWLKKAETDLVAKRNVDAKNAGEVLSQNYDIDCGPSGKVYCPVCKGAHVIIKKGSFGNEYKTCPYCNEHGLLTCDEYNLLIRGELKPKL